MKKVLIAFVSFIKQLFLRLRLVITLSVGRNIENEETSKMGDEETHRKDV